MVTPDGCPVTAYAALPAEPDLSKVRELVADKRRVLDLGAGAGRIAEPLAAAGHEVVAVDESAEMLAHLTLATPIRSRIETFASGDRFDAVLLLSHLINTPDEQQRQAILAAAARHLAPDGLVVIQRHEPGRRLRPGTADVGDVHLTVTDVDDGDWPRIRATTHYRVGGQTWAQSWEAVVLDDVETKHALAQAGLRAVEIDGPWVLATLDG